MKQARQLHYTRTHRNGCAVVTQVGGTGPTLGGDKKALIPGL